MADEIIKAKSHKIKPRRSSCFPSCFIGLSGDVFQPVRDENSAEILRFGGRKKLRWFSWSRFRMKKSVTKTVPVDGPVVVDKKEFKAKDSDMITGKLETSATTHQKPGRILEVIADVEDQSANQKPQKAKYGSSQIILESRKRLEALASGKGKDDTCQNQLTIGRKTEWKKGSSQPSSPVNKAKCSAEMSNMISQSSPSTPLNRPRTAQASGRSRLAGKKAVPETNTLTKKLEAVVALSILMVTLAIMLMWGRICAIVCTSAWLYVIPRLRTSHDNAGNVSEYPDFSSQEHKKKVVLEGLLERNHRTAAGISYY